MANLERELLIAVAATKLRSMILESSRELGIMLKARGLNVKEIQSLALDIYAEAIETLITLQQQETEKQQ